MPICEPICWLLYQKVLPKRHNNKRREKSRETEMKKKEQAELAISQ